MTRYSPGLFAPEVSQLRQDYADYVYQHAQRWIRLPQSTQHHEVLIAFRDQLLRIVYHLPNLAALELYKEVTSRGVADGINFLVLALYAKLTDQPAIRCPASADRFLHFLALNHRLEQTVAEYIELRHAPFYGGLPHNEQEVLLNLELLSQQVFGEGIEQVFACSDPVCFGDN